ncbi:hypothetical protein V9T40_000692 [Parthenolecanium corni]|uniref:Uncharacterized protein n=1 Tax=Parthenolecanium corni TaxID=536013 RepID=A0AAN9Y1Z3_9HEMI
MPPAGENDATIGNGGWVRRYGCHRRFDGTAGRCNCPDRSKRYRRRTKTVAEPSTGAPARRRTEVSERTQPARGLENGGENTEIKGRNSEHDDTPRTEGWNARDQDVDKKTRTMASEPRLQEATSWPAGFAFTN